MSNLPPLMISPSRDGILFLFRVGTIRRLLFLEDTNNAASYEGS